jgi:Txe/YoeB family toxin of Txe-Axe toxin-antitoxin module
MAKIKSTNYALPGDAMSQQEFEQMIKNAENGPFHSIEQVKPKLKKLKTKYWFDELNQEQQKDVLEGLSEADRGETVPHSEVVKLFGKWGLE